MSSEKEDPDEVFYNITKVPIEMITIRKSEADIIIFRLGTDDVAVSQRALNEFSKHVEMFMDEVDIPCLVVPKSTVEVKAVKVYKEYIDGDENDNIEQN